MVEKEEDVTSEGGEQELGDSQDSSSPSTSGNDGTKVDTGDKEMEAEGQKGESNELSDKEHDRIDKAIDKHNKTATVISAILGGILLAFYSHGVLSLVGRV